MQALPPGKYRENEIAADLGLTTDQKAALKDGLKKRRKVVDELAAIGVDYIVEGKSRGAKSYLVRRH